MPSKGIRQALPTSRVRPFWPALAPFLVAIAYYLSAETAFAIGTLTQEFAPFWPPNVVLLCTFLLMPARYWPLYVAAAFPAHVLAEWGVAMPLPQLLAAFGCNVSVAILIAIGLRSLLKGPSWLGSLRNAALYLLVAVIICPALIATLAGFEPMLGDGAFGDYGRFWWRWYLANALGNLTLTPFFLAWAAGGVFRIFELPNRRRLIEALLIALGLSVTCVLAFDTRITAAMQALFPALLFLPMPLFIAAAVRFGARGASGAILIFTVAVLIRAMNGADLLDGLSPGYNVVSIQLFMAVIATPIILLASVVEELRNTNERLSAVLDGISDCYFTLDRSGRITGLNRKGAAWIGIDSPEEAVGRLYSAVAASPEKAALVRRAIDSGIPAREEIFSANGRWVDIRAYPSAHGVNIFYHDTTERRAAEDVARSTQKLLQSSLNALHTQVAILDRDGCIIATNTRWEGAAQQLVRLGERYFVGTNYIEECARGRPHQRLIAEGIRKMLRGEETDFRCEFASDAALGTWLQLRVTRFGRGDELRFVIACEDISEVKTAEASLRQLTGKMLRLQEEERRRIARELHDSTAQNLLGASLGIGQALRLTPRMKVAARAALEESRSLIEQSQREIRTVSYLLHPPMLDEAGLPAALRWFCEGFAKRTDIAVDLDISPGIERLPSEIEAALFRVAQEGLTNVHRHAASASARIRLGIDTSGEGGSSVLLLVEDAGKGMRKSIVDSIGFGHRSIDLRNIGIGLAGMRERLVQIGGSLDITSGPGGTTVRAKVPMSRSSALADA